MCARMFLHVIRACEVRKSQRFRRLCVWPCIFEQYHRHGSLRLHIRRVVGAHTGIYIYVYSSFACKPAVSAAFWHFLAVMCADCTLHASHRIASPIGGVEFPIRLGSVAHSFVGSFNRRIFCNRPMVSNVSPRWCIDVVALLSSPSLEVHRFTLASWLPSSSSSSSLSLAPLTLLRCVARAKA